MLNKTLSGLEMDAEYTTIADWVPAWGLITPSRCFPPKARVHS